MDLGKATFRSLRARNGAEQEQIGHACVAVRLGQSRGLVLRRTRSRGGRSLDDRLIETGTLQDTDGMRSTRGPVLLHDMRQFVVQQRHGIAAHHSGRG